MAMLVGAAGLARPAFADNRVLYESLVSNSEIAFADQCFAWLRQRNYAAIEAKLDPALRTPAALTMLERMANLVPRGEPLGSDIFHALVTTTNGVRRTHLTFDYRFPDAWLVANFTEQQTGDGLVLSSFDIDNRMAQSLWAMNALSLDAAARKPTSTLLVAAAAVVVPTFILITAVFCLMTPIPWRRKWLWLVFVLVGFTELSVEWITGETHFNLLSFLLLGSSLEKGGALGGWVFSMSLPVGAFIYWFKRPGWMDRHRQLMEQVELELRKEDL